MREPLSREEVIRAIEHRGPSRVPMILHHYSPQKAFAGREKMVKELLAQYPTDVAIYSQHMPTTWSESWGPPEYAWVRKPAPTPPAHSTGLDAQVAIADWAQLDEVLANQPDPQTVKDRPKCDEDPFDRKDRYAGVHWCNCLYEKAWKLRAWKTC